MKKQVFLEVLKYYSIIALILFSWSNLPKVDALICIYVSSIIFIYMIVILKEKINLIKKIINRPVPLIIGLYVLFTTIYSIEPRVTIGNAIPLILATVWVIMISVIYSKKQFYDIIEKYFIISIVMSYLFIILIPSIGMMGYEGYLLPKGVYSHKNVLARYMVLACFIFINNLYANKSIINKGKNLILFILALVLLIISGSVTSLIYVIIFLVINWLLINKKISGKLYSKVLYLIIIIFNTLILIISNKKFNDILSRMNFFGKDLTFTGRTWIWNFSLINIIERPIEGYGFEAFWKNYNITADFNSIHYFVPAHSHNGYLGLCLDGGIILLIMTIILVYKAIQNNINENKYNRISLLYLGFILLINLTETAFISNMSYLFWIIICFSYLENTKNIKGRK